MKRGFLLCIMLMLLTLLALARPVSAVIVGGPIIDASIYGNRELFPGQTVPVQILVENGGVVVYVEGYDTPSATVTQGSTITTSATSYTSGDQGAIKGAGASMGTPAAVGAQASGTKALTTSSTSQYSASYKIPFDDLEANVDPGDIVLASTAIGMTCDLFTGDTPIAVVSDPHIVYGSLPSGTTTPPLTYFLRVHRNASSGVYTLPLVVTYKHLVDDVNYASPFGPIFGFNNYVEEQVVIPLEFIVEPMFDLVVSDVHCENMVPGSEGIVTVHVKNIGELPTGESVVFLSQPWIGPPQEATNVYDSTRQKPTQLQQSMLIPVQNAQYVGDMNPGDEKTACFRVAISEDAVQGVYPMMAMVTFADPWGVQMSSNARTFGVEVEPRMRFDIDSMPVEIKCGRDGTATVTLTNCGTVTARDAIVRINALDPFTVSYDTAYLGDVEPGDNATTKFGLKVRSDAMPNTYYVTLEVKYYDSSDDPHVTRIIRKAVTVLPPPTLLETLMDNWPLLLVAAVLVVAGGVYYILRRNKRLKGNNGKN